MSVAPNRATASDNVKITTKLSTFVGTSDQEVVSFLGIPYAKPFSGALRWLPPVAAGQTNQPIETKEFGSPCPHMDKFKPQQLFIEAYSGDTDCLNLNIWIPKKSYAQTDQQKIPVMVFFPGGGFQVGSSSWTPFGMPIYHGANLAVLGNVIVVSINYRTGTSGFFYESSLFQREAAVGNLGLLDQIEALKWVKANVGLFGGDDTNVTAFGSSSGAMSICNLLASADAKSLFDKAIIESGSCWLSSPAYALKISEEIVHKVGCDQESKADERAKCLLDTSIEKIVGAEPEMDYKAPTLDNFKFSPVLDGAFFKTLPDNTIKARQHHAVPILIGSNEHEIPDFMMPDDKESWEKLFNNWHVDPEEKTKVRSYYEKKYDSSYQKMLSKLKTNYFYTCRARYFAGLLADHQEPPVYLYHFDKDILDLIKPWMKGSFHGMELFYVFQNVPPYRWLPGVSPHIDFQNQLGKLWTHFAYFGNVNSDPAWKDWKPYSTTTRIVGTLGDNNGTLADPHGPACLVLEKIMNKANAGISLVE